MGIEGLKAEMLSKKRLMFKAALDPAVLLDILSFPKK